MLSPLKFAILSIPPDTLPDPPRYGGATTTQSALSQLHTLERRTSPPRQKDVGQPIKVRYGPFLETALAHIIYLQTYGKDAWTIFELMELQDVRLDRQSTIDRGSKAKRLFVSFSLCGTTEAQHPFHFKRRDPFSRHQRSHYLFWKVLSFPLLLLKVLIY